MTRVSQEKCDKEFQRLTKENISFVTCSICGWPTTYDYLAETGTCPKCKTCLGEEGVEVDE